MSMEDDYYPMNQDGLEPETLIYNSNMEWLSGFVERQAELHNMDKEAVIAQVEKDLRMLLDQNFSPS